MAGAQITIRRGDEITATVTIASLPPLQTAPLPPPHKSLTHEVTASGPSVEQTSIGVPSIDDAIDRAMELINLPLRSLLAPSQSVLKDEI